MIQVQSRMDVADNSGAKEVMCIKLLGGTHRQSSTIGDIVVVVVKKAIPRAKVKQGEIFRAVIVRVRKKLKRNDGTSISFDRSACVLINKQGEPVGTRIFGPVTRELRALRFMKIISLAPEVL